jgi:predicted nuclease with TOPRIM domain
MMNIRQRSVNVSRLQLLEKLKTNLEIHRREYKEAVSDFRTRLMTDLENAVQKVGTMSIPELRKLRIDIQPPANHERDYTEVIEMLEMSVDDNINLDSDSFRAYIKNEWHWQSRFSTLKAMYKSGTFLTGAQDDEDE